MISLCAAVKLLLRKLREQTTQGLIQRRQKLMATLQNVSTLSWYTLNLMFGIFGILVLHTKFELHCVLCYFAGQATTFAQLVEYMYAIEHLSGPWWVLAAWKWVSCVVFELSLESPQYLIVCPHQLDVYVHVYTYYMHTVCVFIQLDDFYAELKWEFHTWGMFVTCTCVWHLYENSSLYILAHVGHKGLVGSLCRDGTDVPLATFETPKH